MGKYKLWLHHQEIGRRLRDQISTLEQERARIQKMAPTQQTSLPETDNPIVTALLAFTQNGNKLSNIDVIKAALPKLDKGPDQPQPAPSVATAAPARPATVAGSGAPASVTRPATPAADSAVVASLLARAEQMPGDPLAQMQAMTSPTLPAANSGNLPGKQESPRPAPSAQPGASGQASDSVGGWLQRRQREDQD